MNEKNNNSSKSFYRVFSNPIFRNFTATTLATTSVLFFSHPLDVASTRLMKYSETIRQQKLRNSMRNFSRIVLRDAHDQGSLRVFSELYTSFPAALKQRVFVRSLRYGLQPPVSKWFMNNLSRQFSDPKIHRLVSDSLSGIFVCSILAFMSSWLDTARVKAESGQRKLGSGFFKANYWRPTPIYVGRSGVVGLVLFATTTAILLYPIGLTDPSKANAIQKAYAVYPATLAAVIVGHPFAVVKTRQQLLDAGEKKSVISIGKEIIQQQGIRGFRRGFGPSIVSSVGKGSAFYVALLFTDLFEKINQSKRDSENFSYMRRKP